MTEGKSYSLPVSELLGDKHELFQKNNFCMEILEGCKFKFQSMLIIEDNICIVFCFNIVLSQRETAILI